MAKHTIRAYVYQLRYAWSDATEYRVYNSPDMGDDVCALVGPVEVAFEVPDDFDPRAAKIAALEKEKQQLRAALAVKVTNIDRRISELQAITCEAAS